MRIVLDTNVIVSALVFGGLPRAVLELVEAGLCEFFYTEPIQFEVERVLLDKFDWGKAELDSMLQVFWWIGRKVAPRHSLQVVLDDPDDDRILECAIAARANAIISGDRHLLKLRAYNSIPILSPREFLDEYFPRQTKV